MKLLIFLGIIMLLSLVFLLTLNHNKYTIEEKFEICNNSCSIDGWENSEYLGYGFCNCYNRTIILEKEVSNGKSNNRRR